MKNLPRINLFLTSLFLIATVVAAVTFTPATRAAGVVVDLSTLKELKTRIES